MLTTLLLAIFAVGLFAASTLYRIERQLAAWRAEHPAAFTPDELARQRIRCEQAAFGAQNTLAAWQERWGGKTLSSAEDEAECRRQSQEIDYQSSIHNREVRHLSMMVQANARVRLGRDLLSKAVHRVNMDYVQACTKRNGPDR